MSTLFVDDRRPCPQTGYDYYCQGVEEAKTMLLCYPHFDVVSLDYDLGDGTTGLEILEFMYEKKISVSRINIHSDHSVGREEMSLYCATHFPDTEVTLRMA